MKVACVVPTLNEEPRIRECLKHLRPYVDYLLVLDGGSSDKTVEIATEYADRVAFKEPSKMMGIAEDKNYARTLVPKDCGWILWVDADERFDSGFLRNIKETLKVADKRHQVCFRFPRINLPDVKDWPDYQIRLIRNSKDIEFGGEVFPETDDKDSPQDVPFYIPENIPLDQIDREDRNKVLGITTVDTYPILHLPRRRDVRREWWK